MITCNACGVVAALDDVLCPRCGRIMTAGESLGITCENHPAEAAVACCVMCGKPVCGDCATNRDRIFLCDASGDRMSAADWEPAFVADNAFEADVIMANLLNAGIKSRAADPRLFNGTLGIKRELKVRILVERAMIPAAGEVVQSLRWIASESKEE